MTGDSAGVPERAKAHPVRRILFVLAFVVAAGAFASLLGWDIRGWFERLWDTITTISAEYIVAAVVAQTVKTTATGYAWYAILTYAYPAEVRFRVVLAAYAACVALNCILPANLGTLVMFVMLTTVIASATFAGMLGGFLVQKIFFTLAACFVWLYLFFTVPGSFDISFEFIKDNPWAVALLLVAGAVLLAIAIRSFWPRVLKWWQQAKNGGQILAHPSAYFSRVFLPEFIAWVAGLVIVAVFMAAYSLAQQIITTAWSLLLALILMIWVFGWAGGRALLEHSYAEAKRRAEEQTQRGKAENAPAAEPLRVAPQS